jgi:hypothetical protein
MRLQYIFRPYCEVLDQDALKLQMVRHVGGQIPTHKRDNSRDAGMSETLKEGFASNHSARPNDEDLHRTTEIAGLIIMSDGF